jgi:polysaccharide pyruvyl transferase WcaK-like protein
MKRLLLVGYYGHGNFGDDLILETLLRTLGDDFALSAVDNGHANCRQISALQAEGRFRRIPIYSERRPFLSKLNALLLAAQMVRHGARHDVLAFGGGTQLFETRKNGVLPLVSKALYVLLLRRLFGVRIVHLFVGVNAPRTWLGKALLRLILRTSDFLILRDVKSLEQCRSLGVPAERLRLATDTVYLLHPITKATGSPRRDAPLLGISIFPYFSRVESDGAADADYARRVRRAVATLEADMGVRPRLRFIGSQISGSLNDTAYAQSLAGLFAGFDVDFIPYEGDTDAHLAQLAEFDMVIAMRLHVLISSVLAGVPKIAVLPYQAKVAEEARSLGIAALPELGQFHWTADDNSSGRGALRAALNRDALAAMSNRIWPETREPREP